MRWAVLGPGGAMPGGFRGVAARFRPCPDCGRQVRFSGRQLLTNASRPSDEGWDHQKNPTPATSRSRIRLVLQGVLSLALVAVMFGYLLRGPRSDRGVGRDHRHDPS